MFRAILFPIVIMLLASGCSYSMQLDPEPAKPVVLPKPPELGDQRITAHRGSSRKAPENTKKAVSTAIEDGAGYAEIDVMETSDGEIILSHDDTWQRTAGVNKAVWELSYAETRKLEVGGWFHEQFRGEPVPTLGEIMEITRGRIRLNIELKNNKHDQRLPERVAELIRTRNMEPECIVASFDPVMLERFRKTGISVPTVMLIGNEQTLQSYRLSAEPHEFVSIKSTLITEDIIKQAKAAGRQVLAWTVNDEPTIERMLDYGVHSVITSYPDKVKTVIASRKTP